MVFYAPGAAMVFFTLQDRASCRVNPFREERHRLERKILPEASRRRWVSGGAMYLFTGKSVLKSKKTSGTKMCGGCFRIAMGSSGKTRALLRCKVKKIIREIKKEYIKKAVTKRKIPEMDLRKVFKKGKIK